MEKKWDKLALTKKIELLQMQLDLLEKMEEIELQLDGVVVAIGAKPEVAENAAQKRRGRPPLNRPVDAVQGEPKRRGRPPRDPNSEKGPSLPSLLETIAKQTGKPLTQAEYVVAVREAGYASQAKDISNMVYQALRGLVKKGRFEKDEAKGYVLIEKAA